MRRKSRTPTGSLPISSSPSGRLKFGLDNSDDYHYHYDKEDVDRDYYYRLDDGGEEKEKFVLQRRKQGVMFIKRFLLGGMVLIIVSLSYRRLKMKVNNGNESKPRSDKGHVTRRFWMMDDPSNVKNPNRVDGNNFSPILIAVNVDTIRNRSFPSRRPSRLLYEEDNLEVEEYPWERQISHEEIHSYGYSAKNEDPYYAFDDDKIRGQGFETSSCRRTAFHRMYNPVCNVMHEFDLTNENSSFAGRGYYRAAFKYNFHDMNDLDSFIFKTMQFQYHDFDVNNWEFQRNDAMMMQLLQPSPHIIDMYAHCAFSLITETAIEDIEHLIMPTGGIEPEEGLMDEDDVNPMNNLTVSEKLELSLELATCLAEMHGFEGGMLVHDDVQPSQFWRGKDGNMKIIDFNRAEAMLYDEAEGKYCKYVNGPVMGTYRAPEEIMAGELDEKIDIFSLGNILYSILTGLWIYYDYGDDTTDVHDVQSLITHGNLTYIDSRYDFRSFGEAFLVRLMNICWFYYADQRPSIFEVIELLEIANEINEDLTRSSIDTVYDEWIEILDETIYFIRE